MPVVQYHVIYSVFASTVSALDCVRVDDLYGASPFRINQRRLLPARYSHPINFWRIGSTPSSPHCRPFVFLPHDYLASVILPCIQPRLFTGPTTGTLARDRYSGVLCEKNVNFFACITTLENTSATIMVSRFLITSNSYRSSPLSQFFWSSRIFTDARLLLSLSFVDSSLRAFYRKDVPIAFRPNLVHRLAHGKICSIPDEQTL